MSQVIPNANQSIAGYTLLDRLGAGGYGEVWRAEGPGGLAKAVKIVFGGFNESRAARELKSLARVREVRHPFVLSLERIEIVDDRLIIVSELADMSLRDRLRECWAAGLPGVPRAELFTYLRDAAAGLDHLHDRHALQHLDIKPENLLLVGGRLKVADFGLVKDMHESQVSILDGMTPAYAPPELFSGMPHLHSDQYSLAVVYCESLANELPFLGRTAAEWASLHVSPERRPNLDFLPAADRSAIARALSREPQQRFANCTEFVSALEAGSSTTARGGAATGSTVAKKTAASKSAPLENHRTERLSPSLGGLAWDSAAAHQKAISAAAAVAPRKLDAKSTGPAATANQPSVIRSTFCNQNERPPVVRLPRLTLSSEPWQPRPTLVIGIGGTAAHVLGGLRTRLTRQLGRGDSLPSLGLLLLETDPDSLTATHSEATHWSEAETLLMPLRSTREYREESQELLRWISRRWLYNIPPDRRTNGFRPLGRLAFVDHGPAFMKRLRSELGRVLDPNSVQQTSAIIGAPLGPNPRVIVVASACGGTGSGMLHDVGFAARQILAELNATGAEVMGVLTVSASRDEASRDLALSNACACLQELRHFATSPRPYPGEPWCGIQPAQPGQAPFDRTYVVQMGQELSRDEYQQQCDLVSEYLFQDLATPLGATLQKCRQTKPASLNVPPGEPLMHSFRLLPLARCEGEVFCDTVLQLRRQIVCLLLSTTGSQGAPTPEGTTPAEGESPAQHEAEDMLRRLFGKHVGAEFLRVVGQCIQRTRAEGRQTGAAIETVLTDIRGTFQEWLREAEEHDASDFKVKNRDTSQAVQTAIAKQLQAVIPEVAQGLAARFFDSLRATAPQTDQTPLPAGDLLRAATGRLESSTVEVVQAGLRQVDLLKTLFAVLGEPQHAILRWREFVTHSSPEALAVGGARHLLHLAPVSSSQPAAEELFGKVLQEPLTFVPWKTPAVMLCQEAQGIPLGPLTQYLVGYRDLYLQAAQRLHARIDIDWSEATVAT